MKHCLLLIVVWMLVTSPVVFAAEETCITCHQNLSSSVNLGHNFSDWKKSVHAVHHVGCASCHGGNPQVSNPVEAHQWVLSSRKEKSLVYFQKVSETCGRCHKGEFEEFQKSAHYRTLQKTGKGPNCLTCHGAMATTILTYADLDQTCSLCHGKPTRAAQAFQLLHSVKKSLDRYQKKMQSQKKEPSPEFTNRYNELQRKWHSFDVVSVIEMSKNLIQDLKNTK